MKTFLIFKKLENNTYGEKMSSYQAEQKDDTSANRSYLLAEPMASHFELPENMDEDCVDLIWQEAIEGVEAQGIEGEEDYVPAIPAQEAKYILVENPDKVLAKRQRKANSNLDSIRMRRQPLLVAADHEINTMEDDGLDATAMRAYRKALRECTNDLKKVSGEAKLSLENMDASSFEFPSKPE
jgi:hypothetical protein